MIEEGFALGAMAFGGNNLTAAAAMERSFQEDTAVKGSRLADSLTSQLGGSPDFVAVFYDPLCGADVEEMLAGLQGTINCPIVGGGAGQPVGRPVRTFQYFNQDVVSGGVVALGLRGPFGIEVGVSHGTVSTGLAMTITKSDGPRILTIDGRPALECWAQATGVSVAKTLGMNDLAAWAVAVERTAAVAGPEGTAERTSYVIRMPYGIDRETGSITMSAAIPEGTRIKIHHRERDMVLRSSSAMAGELGRKVALRKPWASLGFECGGRTSTFLGAVGTADENRAMRAVVAPHAPWLGMMAWGEIAPCNGRAAFHNYTYPLVVFTES